MADLTSRVRRFPSPEEARAWLEARGWRRISTQPEIWEPAGGGPGAVLDPSEPATIVFRVDQPVEE